MDHGQDEYAGMLISEFAKTTGLSLDTIRYYIRRDLLRPQHGAKGGRNPYQIFTARDVSTADHIRVAQALGLSLRQIAALLEQERAGDIDALRTLAILRERRDRLASKAEELGRLVGYLDAKITWVVNGCSGEPPCVNDFLKLPDARRSLICPAPQFAS